MPHFFRNLDSVGTTQRPEHDLLFEQLVTHKVGAHLESRLREWLHKHPANHSRDNATIEALRATSSDTCDVESVMSKGNHELRDQLHGRLRVITRIALNAFPDLEKLIYEHADASWQEHKLRLAELVTARREDEEKKARKLIHRQKIDDEARLRSANQMRRDAAIRAQEEKREKELLAAKEAEHTERMAERKKFEDSARELMEKNFLEFERMIVPKVFDHDDDVLKRIRIEGVRKWLSKRNPEMMFEDSQIDAISTVTVDALVTARAGSGKTTVIVWRAIFMLVHCKIPAEEILIICFNRAAAQEIRKRIRDVIETLSPFGVRSESPALPEVRTFHSLAYKLVESYRDSRGLPILRYLKDNHELDTPKSTAIQAIVKRTIAKYSQPSVIEDLMFRHFETDWLQIISHEDLPRIATSIEWNSYARQAMDGNWVKSRGERRIADLLFRHGIDYKYEWGIKVDSRNFRPDFNLNCDNPADRPILVEFIGMVGDSDYDSKTESKFRSYENAGIPVLKIRPDDVDDEKRLATQVLSFAQEQLGESGPYRELSREELIVKVMQRRPNHFEKLLSHFIGKCRIAGISPAQAQGFSEAMAVRNDIDRVVKDFYAVASLMYDEYLAYLSIENEEDFDGLISTSCAALEESHTRYVGDDDSAHDVKSFRYVSIDEFQDFSLSFQRLVEIIIRITQAKVFAVGDDWQSINSFMGAIKDAFGQFRKAHPAARNIVLPLNHRSRATIVNCGNAVMSSRAGEVGGQATSVNSENAVWLIDVANLWNENSGKEGDTWAKSSNRGVAARRIIGQAIRNRKRVVVLSRRKSRPVDLKQDSSSPALNCMREVLSNGLDPKAMEIPETLETSSTHAFKGKEADVVIVWDGDAGSYPLVHPDWVFNNIFGTSLEDVIAEEQRLAYVAVTRAREHLFIISDGPASPLFNAGRFGISYVPPRLPENLVPSPRTENPETKSNT